MRILGRSRVMSPDDHSERDPLFQYDDPIFNDGSLLEISHVPDPDRIVGRDEHMAKVAEALNPAIFGSAPSHLFIFGKTGTGKSLISRSVSERVATEANRDGVTVEHVFVDCGEQDTETAIVKTIGQSVNNPETTGILIPDRGLGTSDYYDRLWTAIDTCSDVSIVILDEIDMLQDDEVLRKLSRAGENRSLTNSRIGIIGISNKIDFPDELSERVKSSLSRDELVFPPYDATQLTEILEKRRDAFHEGILEDGVIELTAALAAQEHGDARKAIDILRNAGRIAKKENADVVSEAHVRAGKERAEVDRFSELISGAPTQAKAILYALVLLTEENDQQSFQTKTIYNVYKNIVDELGMNVLSERRIQELLKEQDFLNVIQSEHTGRGRGRGATGTHRLLEDTSIVKQVLVQDSRLSEIVE